MTGYSAVGIISKEEFDELYREFEHLSLNAEFDANAGEAFREKFLKNKIEIAPLMGGTDLESVFKSVGDLLRNAMSVIDGQIRSARKTKSIS